ncbi:hypothetical protein [Deinococcus daejeonensis]|uniref:Uncharacterized protein n=1 Tax=Deinococcus daejeonensis TaxID=1007098 RepID=A0ABQ2IYA6_9DEIO|nr:hypothetical protein [Deinococcus daejeonensis]GGN34700.1 hypothetical protein GCM10010842_13670 [Deinococcus daejeonensis]
MKKPVDTARLTTDLLAREVEVVFLELLARDPNASAWQSVQSREVDTLSALRRRLAPAALTVDDVLRAAETSPAVTCRSAPAQILDGQLSQWVLHCNPRKLPGVTAAATRTDFNRLAEQLNAAGHRPIPGLSTTEVTLKAVEGFRPKPADPGQPHPFEATVNVQNVGYGSADAVEVSRVVCPPWVNAVVDGRRITLRANLAFNGCYRGPVTVETSAGPATLTVSSGHWHAPASTEDRVNWRSLVTSHAHLDHAAAAQRIEEHLLATGYRPLAGGFFARDHDPAEGESSAPVQAATHTWVINSHHLEEARLAAQGHAPLVRLYAPDGTDRYDVPYDGEALHGDALADLLLMWDVKVGWELHLSPYRGHYQFTVRRPGTWLHAAAAEYRAVSTLQALNRTPLFWDLLEDWLTAGVPVKLLLQDNETSMLQELRRRFPAHLECRTAKQSIGESRLYCLPEEGGEHVFRLPHGQNLHWSPWPGDLWTQSGPMATQESDLPSKLKSGKAPSSPTRPSPPVLPAYEVWQGPVAHPLLMGPEKVLLSVKAILEVEGPMVGHHLYARYGEAVRASKSGAVVSPMQLKKTLNPLLYRAVQAGQLTAEDELSGGGQIGLVYRLPGQATRPRQKGDRTLAHIPVSELRAVVATLPRRPGQPHADELEQVAWVLEQFGFGRFIDGGVERVRPLLRERSSATGPAEPSSRRRVR